MSDCAHWGSDAEAAGRFKKKTIAKDRNLCPVCKKDDDAELRNHSLMWHDGTIWCRRCDVKIRDYDAG